MATQRNSNTYRVNRKKLRDRCEALGIMRCVWCGVEISDRLPRGHPRKFTADHVIPIAQGGTHELENLVPACFECNCKRQDKGTDWKPSPDVPGSADW